MAKQQDNPKTEVKAPVAEQTAPTVQVEMAPLQASVDDRLAALEKRVNETTTRRRNAPAVINDPIDVHLCNRRNREVMSEVRAEKRSAFEVAKEALKTAFAGRGRLAKRAQKDLAPHITELRSQAQIRR